MSYGTIWKMYYQHAEKLFAMRLDYGYRAVAALVFFRNQLRHTPGGCGI
jgi:hypothetical protein